MKTALALALVVVSLVGYMVLDPMLGLGLQVPWPGILLALIGISWLVWLLRQQFSIMRLVSTTLAVLLLGAFSWYAFFFSEYETVQAPILQGEHLKSPELVTLIDGEAQAMPLVQVLNQAEATLLVFYRGHW